LRGPELVIAFLPQPSRSIDIVGLELQLDNIFTNLCATGMAEMRHGYEPCLGKDWTGLKTEKSRIAYFPDGQVVIIMDPTVKQGGFFCDHFAPPSVLKKLAMGAVEFVKVNSAWCQIELRDMENIAVKEFPENNSNSFSMSMSGENSASFSKLFVPLTPGAYSEWVDVCLKRFERIFNQ